MQHFSDTLPNGCRPTGCGKTFAATGFACDRIPQGAKFAFVQPTIGLCRQSHRDAQKRFTDIEDRIRTITSRRGADDSIAHRITTYLNGRDETGGLLFMTHAGFLRTPHWHHADTWHLLVDEPPEITYSRMLRLKEHRHLVLDLFRPSHHEGYGHLEARNGAELDVALATVKDDEIYEHFADLIWRLRQGDWDLYVEHSAYERFRSGEMHTIEIHGLLSPSIFSPFASVTLMGANLDDSIMYKYFAKLGCTFSPHRALALTGGGPDQG